MFGKITSIYHTKLFKNFNSENEKFFDVKVNGAQPFEENLWLEPMSSINITEKGGYVGILFCDFCKGNVENFGCGVYLDVKGNIIYKGNKINKTQRIKLSDDEGVIIETGDYSALFYPFLEKGLDIYLDYVKETNSVGFVSVKSGISEPKMRNVMKFGCSFSKNGKFYHENAEFNLFNECSFLTLCNEV